MEIKTISDIEGKIIKKVEHGGDYFVIQFEDGSEITLQPSGGDTWNVKIEATTVVNGKEIVIKRN